MEEIDPIPSHSPVDRMHGMKDNGTETHMKPSFDLDALRAKFTDDNEAPVLLGVGGALLFVAIVLLTARLWSRLRPVSKLYLDDFTVLGATILAVAQYGILIASVHFGLGHRSIFIRFHSRLSALRLVFISQVVWYWAITLTKLSVALLLLRVKSASLRWKVLLYFLIVLTLVAAIVQTVFQFLQCRPFSVFWDPRVFKSGEVKCFHKDIINGNIVAFSSVQVALDLIFSFIPPTFIRKLNRPRREKIFMCVLMALGLFASVAAVVRTMILQDFYTTYDIFRNSVSVTLWAVLEQQLALIAATIPTLKSFMEMVLIRIGQFFYDEGAESHVRWRMVQIGLLGEGEKIEERRPSAAHLLGISSPTGTVGSPKSDKRKDELGVWSINSQHDKDIEDMVAKMPA